MSKKDPTQLRIEIARGHWALGEIEEAVVCLERAVSAALDPNTLMLVVGTLLDDVASEPVNERLIALRDCILERMEIKAGFQLPEPLATPTMAQLLADQGHPEKARAVANVVLEKDPDNERARAVRDSLGSPLEDRRARTILKLERLLAAAQRRSQREAIA
ncbi:MAG: hypothetical protein GY725_17890 [bacterium]|nr:hypothetical protein [bacterium]